MKYKLEMELNVLENIKPLTYEQCRKAIERFCNELNIKEATINNIKLCAVDDTIKYIKSKLKEP